jgi:hypothetical protein
MVPLAMFVGKVPGDVDVDESLVDGRPVGIEKLGVVKMAGPKTQ